MMPTKLGVPSPSASTVSLALTASYMRACAVMSARKTVLAASCCSDTAGGCARCAPGCTYPNSRFCSGSLMVPHQSTSPPNSRATKPAYFCASRMVRSLSTQPLGEQPAKLVWQPRASWIQLGSE
jgi:hypothetical protein